MSHLTAAGCIQGSHEGRKPESQEARKPGSKEARKQGSKEGRKQGRTEAETLTARVTYMRNLLGWLETRLARNTISYTKLASLTLNNN